MNRRTKKKLDLPIQRATVEVNAAFGQRTLDIRFAGGGFSTINRAQFIDSLQLMTNRQAKLDHVCHAIAGALVSGFTVEEMLAAFDTPTPTETP
jgi:hypothetical protein